MKLRWIILPILSFVICGIIMYKIWPRSGVVVFKDNFRKGVSSLWSPKTPEKWEWSKEDGKIYRLKEPGKYDSGIIRPTEYSLVDHVIYADFTFKCKLRCDAPAERRYRDLAIIFGYQDDTHFYYVHLSNISDDLHNGIILVDGSLKRKLNMDRPKPILVDQEFHKVELKRNTEDGEIQVYFDGKLVITAQDRTFIKGKIGIGSLDDVGSFDNVYIKGKIPVVAEKQKGA